MAINKIIVSRKDLVGAFRFLSVASSGKYPPDIIISTIPGFLVLKMSSSETKLPCFGQFDKRGRLPGIWISKLKKLFPDSEEIVLTKEEDFLTIFPLRISCLWEDLTEKTISLPINASLVHYLGLESRYSDLEIEKAGLKAKYEASKKQKEEIMKKAYKNLIPLGITMDDLTNFVNGIIEILNKRNLFSPALNFWAQVLVRQTVK